jgi:hypothetical protein
MRFSALWITLLAMLIRPNQHDRNHAPAGSSALHAGKRNAAAHFAPRPAVRQG